MHELTLPAKPSKEEAQSEMQLNFSAGQAQADDFSSSASISKCGRRAYTQQWHCLDRRLGALRFLLSKTEALRLPIAEIGFAAPNDENQALCSPTVNIKHYNSQ